MGKLEHALTPGALQIAAAVESGTTLFVTNDRRVSNVKEIPLLLFDDCDVARPVRPSLHLIA